MPTVSKVLWKALPEEYSLRARETREALPAAGYGDVVACQAIQPAKNSVALKLPLELIATQ